jgi:hypothetical protein
MVLYDVYTAIHNNCACADGHIGDQSLCLIFKTLAVKHETEKEAWLPNQETALLPLHYLALRQGLWLLWDVFWPIWKQ